jgi:hypothetical protein
VGLEYLEQRGLSHATDAVQEGDRGPVRLGALLELGELPLSAHETHAP